MTDKRYRVEFNDEAAKQLEKLDKQVRKRVVLAIAKLEVNPRPDGVKKLKGKANRWRIRVGDWRVVYRIEDEVLIVIVVTVDHRSKVYNEK